MIKITGDEEEGLWVLSLKLRDNTAVKLTGYSSICQGQDMHIYRDDLQELPGDVVWANAHR